MSLQSHPALAAYHAELAARKAAGHFTEEQTSDVFQTLLKNLSAEKGLSFAPEHRVGARRNRKIDGVVKDGYSPLGYWEAKDEGDKLETEIQKKIAIHYPTSNTIFEDTQYAILWQNQREVGKFDLSKTGEVGELLDRFFDYTEADAKGFAGAVANFVAKIPDLARAGKEDRRRTLQPLFQNRFRQVLRDLPIRAQPAHQSECRRRDDRAAFAHRAAFQKGLR